MDFAAATGPFLVIFREGFEIALILGIVLAATKGLTGRKRAITWGAALGIVGSCVIAFFADSITDAAEGTGQELMNAVILLLATAMIGWTVIWMKTHAKHMSKKIKDISNSIREGDIPMTSLTIVIALAIFREGSEMVLFSFGFFAGGMSISSFIIGATGGAIAGTTLGILLYLGLIKISPKYFFSITSWMLTLLAAGMASQAAKYLLQGGYVPDLGGPIWNTAHILSEESVLGEALKILVGYSSSPYGIQIVFYVMTIGAIAGLLSLCNKSTPIQKPVTA
jgi:high-affinity iron transporter